jgi:hypothetical protein
MNAYDLNILHESFDAKNPSHQGWCYGFPPGIAATQWPIDSNSGYPLMHGFTLRLPEDQRVHGPEIVALSFFALAPEHNDGMAEEGRTIAQLLAEHPDSPPADPDLAAMWQHVKNEHPRLHRMEDILGCEYAVILLTEEEYRGAACPVSTYFNGPAFAEVTRPRWVDRGTPKDTRRLGGYVLNALGGDPDSSADFDRAVTCTERTTDPNAGVPAEEFPDDDAAYTSPFDKVTYERLDWAKDLSPQHIGGTMFPVQGVPDVGVHYIGFEEYFGDYNFGGGNAQLDFQHMKFDWACG